MPENRIPIAEIQYGILIKDLQNSDTISYLDELPVSHKSTESNDPDKTYRASLQKIAENLKFYIDQNGNLKSTFRGNSQVKPLSDITVDNLDDNFILPIENGGTGSNERIFLKNTTDILEGQLTVKEKDNLEAYIASVGATSATIGAHTTVEENNSVKVNGVALRTEGNYISLFDSTNSEDIIKKDVLETGSATTFYGTATSATSATFVQYLDTPNIAGYTTDVYGNLVHKRDTAGDTWCIKNNAGTSKASINYESGAMSLATPLTIPNGGTGASTAAAARNNLAAVQAGSGTSAGIFNGLGNTNQLFYIKSVASSKAASSIKGHNTWLVVRNDGLNVWDANNSTAPWDLTFPITIAKGGTGISTASSCKVFAGPTSGAASAPTWRSLVANDIPNLNASKITAGTFAADRIPNLNASKITAGTLPVSRGGTGQTTPFTSHYIANGSGIGSGSTTFSVAGAKLINILARFGDASTGGLVSLTIPNFINSSGSYYQIADDTSFIKFKLRLTSTNNVTMDNFSRTNSNCVITHINLIY